jgi:hypothetical protein
MPGYVKQPMPADMSNDGEAPSFEDALGSAPAEVEPDADDELDAEQAGIVEEMGMTPEQGKALRRFIETIL